MDSFIFRKKIKKYHDGKSAKFDEGCKIYERNRV